MQNMIKGMLLPLSIFLMATPVAPAGTPRTMRVDYYHTGNDLLWKKHMGEQAKPEHWDMQSYAWYLRPNRKRLW